MSNATEKLLEYALAQKVEAFKYKVLFDHTREGYGVSDLPCGFDFAADFLRVIKGMGLYVIEVETTVVENADT